MDGVVPQGTWAYGPPPAGSGQLRQIKRPRAFPDLLCGYWGPAQSSEAWQVPHAHLRAAASPGAPPPRAGGKTQVQTSASRGWSGRLLGRQRQPGRSDSEEVHVASVMGQTLGLLGRWPVLRAVLQARGF